MQIFQYEHKVQQHMKYMADIKKHLESSFTPKQYTRERDFSAQPGTDDGRRVGKLDMRPRIRDDGPKA